MLREPKDPIPDCILGRVKLEMSSYFTKLCYMLRSAKHFIEFLWFSFEVKFLLLINVPEHSFHSRPCAMNFPSIRLLVLLISPEPWPPSHLSYRKGNRGMVACSSSHGVWQRPCPWPVTVLCLLTSLCNDPSSAISGLGDWTCCWGPGRGG